MNLKVLLALLTTMIFWGSSFVATKIVLAVWPSWAFMFLRFSAASVLFLIILARRGRLRIPREHMPRLLLLALFEPGLYFVFETLGLERTTAASSSILIAAIPAVVALSSALLLKEKMSRRGWVGTLVSILGIALITVFDRNSDFAQNSLMGNIFILLAVLSATAYHLLSRSLSKNLTPLQITAYQIFFAAVFFFPGILLQGGQLIRVTVDALLIGSFAFLVVGATVAAFLSYNYALSRVPAPRAALFINGIPVVTVLVGWLVLGEALNWVQALGGALAIGGLMYANRKEAAAITMEA